MFFIDTVDKLVDQEAPGETAPPDIVKAYHVKLVAAARYRSIAVAFLKRADRKAYGDLWTELENQHTRGDDQYPIDLTAAYNLLLNY